MDDSFALTRKVAPTVTDTRPTREIVTEFVAIALTTLSSRSCNHKSSSLKTNFALFSSSHSAFSLYSGMYSPTSRQNSLP